MALVVLFLHDYVQLAGFACSVHVRDVANAARAEVLERSDVEHRHHVHHRAWHRCLNLLDRNTNVAHVILGIVVILKLGHSMTSSSVTLIN